MITLYSLPAGVGLLSASPFCLKVEVYLRMREMAYKTEVLTNPGKGPKGKLPYIVEDGVTVADSGFIIEHLKSVHGDPLAKGVTARNKATAHLLRRTLEESLYNVLVYSRWLDPDGWSVTRDAFFGSMPAPARRVVGTLIQRNIRKSLDGQGYGRHDPAEIYAIGARDLDAIAELIGSKEFMLGRNPTEVDASAYGVLANIIKAPHDTPLKRHALRHENLVAYVDRMTEKYGQ